MHIYYWDKKDNTQLYNLWINIFHDSKNFCDYYFEQKLIDNKILVLEENNEIASMVHLNPYILLFNGLSIKSNYVVGVSTKESYRKKGFLKLLLTKSLNDMYKEKIAFTFLTTVDEKIYTPYNFKFISSCFEIEITNNNQSISFPPINLNSTLFPEFINYYTKKMNQCYDVYILRDDFYMQRILKEMKCENGFIKLFYKDNSIQGYIMLYLYESTIQVREIIYNTCVLNDIISYLQNIGYKKPITITNSLDIQFSHILQNYFKNTIKLKPYVMGRIINLKRFLTLIHSKSSTTINMLIIDTVISENNNKFNWSLSNISSTLIETKDKEDIVIDIGVLCQWLLGYNNIEQIISLNQIIIKNFNIIEDLKLIITCNIFINEVV